MAFTISDIVPAAITIVVAALAVGMGAKVLATIQANEDCTNCAYGTNGTAAWNASEQGLVGLQNFSEFLPTIAIVVISAVIIGIVVYYFRG